MNAVPNNVPVVGHSFGDYSRDVQPATCVGRRDHVQLRAGGFRARSGRRCAGVLVALVDESLDLSCEHLACAGLLSLVEQAADAEPDDGVGVDLQRLGLVRGDAEDAELFVQRRGSVSV